MENDVQQLIANNIQQYSFTLAEYERFLQFNERVQGYNPNWSGDGCRRTMQERSISGVYYGEIVNDCDEAYNVKIFMKENEWFNVPYYTDDTATVTECGKNETDTHLTYCIFNVMPHSKAGWMSGEGDYGIYIGKTETWLESER